MQVEFILLGQRQRRNVLILCGVRGAQNARDIYDRSDVGTVIAAAGGGCGADLRQQIGGGTRSQCRHHGLTVRIVEHQLVCVLR